MFTPIKVRPKTRTATVNARMVRDRTRAMYQAERLERERAYNTGGFVDVTHLPYDLKDRD